MRTVLKTCVMFPIMLIIARAGILRHGPDYSYFPAISLLPLFYQFGLQCGATIQLWPCHNNHSHLVCVPNHAKEQRTFDNALLLTSFHFTANC